MDLVAERPDMTLSEIAALLGEERGVTASRVLLWTFFAKRGVTFKKSQRMLPHGPDLWKAIANALDAFSPQECRNLFAACGYDCE